MKKKRQNQESETPVQRKESSFWMISTFVLAILLIGLVAKTVLGPSSGPSPADPARQTAELTTSNPVQEVPSLEADSGARQNPSSTSANEAPGAQSPETGSLESRFRTVASNFKCACGACGDRLVECICTNAKGAVEMKSFIRAKLGEDLSVDQVIELVEKKYGNRVS
jgi:cytochrome c-type biogenesis protein CcmH/NrfF